MNRIKKILSITLSLFFVASVLSFGHASWVRIEKADDAGKTIRLTVAHGHTFPKGEHDLSAEYVKVNYVSESGAKSLYKFEKPDEGLSGLFNVAKPGIQRFYFVYDHPVMSKTTQGWQEGGKDKYPNAFETARVTHAGNSFLKPTGTEWKEIVPAGLPVELIPVKFGKDMTFRLLKDGKPYEGADVVLQVPGKDETKLGKTDSKGEIKVVLPVEKGEVLITAGFKVKYPAGSELDWENFAAVFYMNLE